ncbi:TPA: hypothetical protein F6W26_22880 [Citrobacter amalonaticus]|uniref:hypothetical protein n=1 Tax=Citrobacter amalonaticus TaxID=35703 RepID=UPI001A2409EE|nr:hypothetical protein [Citrobacter amalonaticus]HCB3234470.1 hypothetical protein [Citrobacter amalonaticus]HCL6056360.1 hypothetical protein [Citrobacter amalonaticus]
MTSPAEQFKANLQARDDASKAQLNDAEAKKKKRLEVEQLRMNHYSDSLHELIPDLKKWAEAGGLKARKVMCSYHDYNFQVSEEALLVSDGHKEIRFVPDGVSRTVNWLGIVQIELPRKPAFHQIYLALDFDKDEQKRTWFFVDYDSQKRSIITKCAVDEVFFFKLMEEVFLS